MKKYIILTAIVLLLGVGCSTDPLSIYPNGDSRLRQLDVKGASLYPDFNPYVGDYYLVMPETGSISVLAEPFIFSTRMTINGETVRIETNQYGLATYTGMGQLLTATNVLRFDLVAADGLSRAYTITFYGADSDPGILNISGSVGVVYPGYVDGSAPFYSEQTVGGETNVYYLEAGSTGFDLLIHKAQSNAVLTVNGSSVGAGVTNGVYGVTIPGDGSTNTYVLTNIASDGRFTNVKYVKAFYQDPDVDTKALDIVVTGSDGKGLPLIPRYSFDQSTYPLCLDDISAINFSVSKSYGGQEVQVLRNSVLVMSNISMDMHVSFESVAVAMGDVVTIRMRSAGGVLYNDYQFPITIFTKNGYGFNGNIGYLYTVIDQLTDWDNSTTSGHIPTHPNQQDITIEGVVTYNNSDSSGNANDSYYVEDDQYGIFVWSYFNKPAGLKVGNKVRIVVEGAKYWFGFAEVTRVVSVTILDSGARYPIHYLDANTVDPGTINTVGTTLRHGARLFKFTPLAGQSIMTGFDESGWGNLDSRLRYKITKPANMDVGDLNHAKYPALDYVSEGSVGTLYGPLYYSTSDGYAIEVSTANYLHMP